VRADTLLFWVYLAFIVFLPLPFGGDIPWAMGVYQVVVFLMAAWWCGLYVAGKVVVPDTLIKARFIIGLFLLWLVYIALQLYTGLGSTDEYPVPTSVALQSLTISPYLTSTAWLMSLGYTLLFFLTLVLVNSRQRVRQLAGVIILSGVFQAMFGSLMTLSGLEYALFVKKATYIGYATGSFYNRNHYAAYLVMCLAVGIGMMIAQLDSSERGDWRHTLRRWLALVFSAKLRLRLYLVIMVIALVLTHSRMGNTAFFASLFICGIIGLALARQASRGVVILLTSLIIIDLFIVGAWFGIDNEVERIENTTVETEERREVNDYATQLWRDNLWMGTGLGTFAIAFTRYREADITSFYKQAHNDYLQFATEVGIIGLLILAAVVVTSLSVAIIAQYKRRDPLMRGLSFAAMMGIIAMLIHATVEFNFQIPPNAAMFVVLMGLAWISRYHRSDSHGSSVHSGGG